MKKKEIRKQLQEAEDKYTKLIEILSKYELKNYEISDLIVNFLDDKQKLKILENEHIINMPGYERTKIIDNIANPDIKMKVIQNLNCMRGFLPYEIAGLIKQLDNDINKLEILKNKELLEATEMLPYYIIDIAVSLKEEKNKFDVIELYQFESDKALPIWKTMSCDTKKNILFSDKYKTDRQNKESLISSFEIDEMIDFFKNNREFLDANEIRIYKIIKYLSQDKQLEVIKQIEKACLTLNEKKQIFASLDKTTKEKIDKYSIPIECIPAFEMKMTEDRIFDATLILDLNGNLERYRGLDELMLPNPLQMTEVERGRLIELCKICPKMRINDNIGLSPSTARRIYKLRELD